MSEQNPQNVSMANPEQVAAYIEKRKSIEAHYAQLVEAHKNEAAYVKLMADMAEDELRNRMSVMRLAELEARLRQGSQEEKTGRKLKEE